MFIFFYIRDYDRKEKVGFTESRNAPLNVAPVWKCWILSESCDLVLVRKTQTTIKIGSMTVRLCVCSFVCRSG